MGFFKKIFGSKDKYGGLIKELGLLEFWKDLSEEEREKIREYSKQGLNMNTKYDIDDPSYKVSNTTLTADNFLMLKTEYAIKDKNFELAQKLLDKALEYNKDPESLHFIYNNLIKLYYKQRDDEKFLNKCIEICKKDIELYEDKLIKMDTDVINEDTKIPSFQRLAIIYENKGEYKKAIDICKKAIKYNLRDTSKAGFEGRLERLEKNLDKD